jgi:hypothetical protein
LTIEKEVNECKRTFASGGHFGLRLFHQRLKVNAEFTSGFTVVVEPTLELGVI